MRNINITLINHCILHCRVNLHEPQKFLHLLNRHFLINWIGCKGATELVRTDIGNIWFLTQFFQSQLHTINSQTIIWPFKWYKQCRIAIITGGQIQKQAQFASSIKINYPFTFTLANTTHSLSWKLISSTFNLTSSPTRMPTDINNSRIARSHTLSQLLHSLPNSSSLNVP